MIVIKLRGARQRAKTLKRMKEPYASGTTATEIAALFGQKAARPAMAVTGSN